MLLFILESIGTWELILIGLVALVIFGPRKLPELARKAGGMMSELRKVSNEFKSTWEREAALGEDERKAFDFSESTIVEEQPSPMIEEVTRDAEVEEDQTSELAPEIKEVTDTDQIDELKSRAMEPPSESSEKENWL